MRLEDFSHLQVVRGSSSDLPEAKLPDVPVEIAEVEFNGSGAYRPIYVCGIHIDTENPERPFLTWTNHVDKITGKRRNILSTYLDEITAYRPISVATETPSNQR